MTIGPRDLAQTNQTFYPCGSSKSSLVKALLKYISLPNAFDQSAQLVPGGGGDIEYNFRLIVTFWLLYITLG
jgi:hypothetical protein